MAKLMPAFAETFVKFERIDKQEVQKSTAIDRLKELSV
jgi:hypothetical protein